jgi:hypothetical protein
MTTCINREQPKIDTDLLMVDGLDIMTAACTPLTCSYQVDRPSSGLNYNCTGLPSRLPCTRTSAGQQQLYRVMVDHTCG